MLMRRFLICSLLSACCGLTASTPTTPAHSQPTATPEVSDAEGRARALALFEQSEALYRDGKFAEAAAKLEEAYRLHQEPILLYNLARARDGNGELEAAVTAYQSYLDSAEEIRDRGAIERRLQTLRQRIAEQQRLAAERAADKQRLNEMEQRQPQQTPDRAPPEQEDSVLGGVLGAMARSKHDDAAAEPIQADAVERQDEAEGLATGANVAFAVGGVLAVAGGTLTVIGLVGSDEPGAAAYSNPESFVGATWRRAF